eukprot:1094626_1
MSAKCGKPKSSLWKYATVQPSESGKPKAKCNLCNHVMSKLQCVRQAFNRTLSREVKDIVLGIWEPTYWEDLDYTLTSNKPLQLTLTTLEGALVNPGCSSSTHDSVTKIFYLKGKRKVKSGWK